YMRNEGSHLTVEENWLWTGTVGLFGGLFLTSDFPSQWTDEARQLIGLFWDSKGPRPPTDWKIVCSREGLPIAIRGDNKIGLYNWSDTPQTICVLLADLQLADFRDATILLTAPSAPPVTIENGCIICELQPPHSLRIAILD